MSKDDTMDNSKNNNDKNKNISKDGGQNAELDTAKPGAGHDD